MFELIFFIVSTNRFSLWQVRLGTPGHRLHARHVRPSCTTPGYLQRREFDVRVLLPSDGANGGELPQRQRHGLPLRQHEIPHTNPRFRDVRTDAFAWRLHAFLFLLSMVPFGFQEGISVSGCVCDVGGDLGGAACVFDAFRTVFGVGAPRDVQRYHSFEFDGFYGYHQIF